MTKSIKQRVLKRKEASKYTGVASSTMYTLMAKGLFPEPIRLTGRSVAWLVTELDAWLDERIKLSKEA